MEQRFLKRTWAEIDLDNLKSNYLSIAHSIKRNSDNFHTKIIPVVKADGYGHGDIMVAKTLQKLGADFFAVSNLDEALSLRLANIKGDIIVLGFTPSAAAEVLYKNNITQTILSLDYAKELNAECAKLNITLNAHIKLDTGMGRIGVAMHDASAFDEIEEIYRLSNLNCSGIFTHLSSADSLDDSSVEYTKRQIQKYTDALSELKERGISFKASHLQNSAGIAFFNNIECDYARAGIILYGVAPSSEPFPFELKPVMSLKSVVSLVKSIDADTAVSYGRTFVSDSPMRLATVPIGYADGYPRLLSNKAYMLIHGKRAKIIGNICMDQLMLDVSDIDDVKCGDIVTVVGKDGGEAISFDELAKITGSISYELMCLIGKRVPRVYIEDGEITEVYRYHHKMD